MLSIIQRSIWFVVSRVEGWGDAVFGSKNNPMYHLGSLGWFSYWVAVVSGIYVYILFDTSVIDAYKSVEYMTHEQWYAGGIMRSLHRYSSDAMILLAIVHMVREFSFGRYHGVRWFAWFTGIPTIWFLFFSGISGYWLVWDQLAQYLAIASMEWIDWLGIFSEPIANNFLTPDSLKDRFFTLLVFIHIFVPIILLFMMWIHLLRISQAETNPPRTLAIGTMLAFLALSIAYPAVSHPPANLATIPAELNLDWFFMALYPIYESLGAGKTWALAVGGSAIIALVPWMRRVKKIKAAEVDLANCNGCERCFKDCPSGAVVMRPRTDGRPFAKEAVVDPSLCFTCGICFGACPTTTPFRTKGELRSGIQLPELDMPWMKAEIDKAMAGVSGPVRLLMFGCDHGADIAGLRSKGIGTVVLPCTGMLAPSFVDYAFSRLGIDGVVITGCRDGECFHRLGVRWTEARVAGERDPQLRSRVPRERLLVSWASPVDYKKFVRDVEAFRAEVAAAKAAQPAPRDAESDVAVGGAA